jgi:diphthamide synthase (EF-2-diphthine--ammonia ligase)
MKMGKPKAAAAWSTGKDSAYAYHIAKKEKNMTLSERSLL